MGEKKHIRRGSLIGPVTLVGAGIVLLLNNLGVLEWSVWGTILRMWPVLLIAAGLDILIGRRSFLGSLVILALILGILAGGVCLFETRAGSGQALASEEILQALDDATQAEVIVAPSVGKLHVEALSGSTSLIEGTVRPFRGERIERDFHVAGERATFSLRSQGTVGVLIPDVSGEQPTWDLRLDPDVPLSLDVSLGVGASDIDLTGMTVSDLSVDVAIGRSKVTLPSEGRFRAKINGAIGETVVIIPADMEARIDVGGGITGKRMPADFHREGDAYVSSGYRGADDAIDLEVSQAIGSIEIRRSRGE